MARVTKVSYGRTVVLGRRGQEKAWASFEADVEDGDDPEFVLLCVRELVGCWEKDESDAYYGGTS